MQAQVEPVELKAPHPDVQQRSGERIEANFAARGGENRSARGVAHRQALKSQTYAP